MYQKPTVPRSIGGVLDDTVQLYKASFARCWVPALLIGVLVTVLGLYQVKHLGLVTRGGTGLQAILARNATTSPQSGLMAVVEFLVEELFYAILIYIIVAVSRGEGPSFGASFTAIMRRLPAMVGATIIVGIIAIIGFGAASVPIIYATARMLTGATLADMLALAGPAVLVTLVLAIPVVYVVSRMQLFLVSLVSESRGPLQSIARSWRLVGGNWWRVSTLVFVMGVMVYVLTLVVIAISGAIAVLVVGLPTGPAQVFGGAVIVGAVVGGLIRVVSAPLLASLYVVIYQDLLLRKGGDDLEARLGALPKG